MYKIKNIIIILVLLVVIVSLPVYFFLIKEGKADFVSCGDAIWYMGKNYATVEIGGVCIFAENLDTEHYRNGDEIRKIEGDEEWNETEEGAYSYYENNKELEKLYNFHAVSDTRGLCPQGWKVPTDEDWIAIELSLGVCEGGESGCVKDMLHRGADVRAGDKMKEITAWTVHGADVVNESGFTALPGGMRDVNGAFMFKDTQAIYWTATSVGETRSWNREVRDRRAGIYRNFVHVNRGLSVRCIKED